jgi:gluconolactonase
MRNSRLVGIAISCLLSFAAAVASAQSYQLGPDSQEHADVPKGKVEKFRWTSQIFHGTVRDGWIYVPAQYDATKPACVTIFQDGGSYRDPKGPWRTPTVLDNLIAAKQAPVMIGIFIEPGIVPAPSSSPGAASRPNRSFEYDTPTDQYARFLLEEILPEVSKKYSLAQDGNSRAICGISSGGICAFNAAWQRPTEFTRIGSFVGSFTNLRGGNFFPDLIRKTEPRPIRVYLQDGKNDLNNFAGNWVIANQDMASALEFAGYDYQYVIGNEGHNARQGGAILPDVLRWLWRDYPAPVKTQVTASKQPLMEVIDPAAPWEQIEGTYGFTEGPAADGKGNLYFSDIPNSKIYRVDKDAHVTEFAHDTGGANGLMFGPDRKLYACQSRADRVVAYDVSGKEEPVADGITAPNDIAIDATGKIYVTEPPKHQVWFIGANHDKTVVAKDPIVAFPNGVRFTPDQSQIVVADTKGVRLWIYQVRPDGQLANREGWYDAQIQPGDIDSRADGMTFDTDGRLYVAMKLGIEVFDQSGRVLGIINKPQNKALATVGFSGPDMNCLYACNSDHIYRRRLRVHGALSWQNPILPKSTH